MADIFDALTTRALGTAALLVPDLTRFGPRDPGPDRDPGPAPQRQDTPSQPPAARGAPSEHAGPPSPIHDSWEATTARPPQARDQPQGPAFAPAPNLTAASAPSHTGPPPPPPEPITPATPAEHPTTREAPVSRAQDVATVLDAPSSTKEQRAVEPATERDPARTSYTASTVPQLRAPSVPDLGPPQRLPMQVTVSIGHVEVRRTDTRPEPRPAPRPHRPEPRLSLQDYLRGDGRR
jgi:hypothetical protein